MARKDLPYLPLYVQDYLTDERLNECSPSTQGVYIKVMCILHKSTPYGKILLKQNDKQTESKIKNFAIKFAKHLPFELPVILAALDELIREECLRFDGDFIYQKRMVDDAELSITRSKSGSEGGKRTQKSKRDFAKAKIKANPDIDIEYIIRVFNCEFSEKEIINYYAMIVKEMMDVFLKYRPTYEILIEEDYHSLLEIAYTIAERKGWDKKEILVIKKSCLLESWEKVVEWLTGEKQVEYYKTMPLDKICTKKGFRDIQERMKTTPILSEIKLKQMESKRITHEQYFEE